MANPNEILARYAFFPWMRQGIGTKIRETDNFNDFSSPPQGGWATGRPEVLVTARIKARKGSQTTTELVDRVVELVGPGDVTGIDQRTVIKAEPQAGTLNFEPNYFPYIEFYEEDFPWRYTPASPMGNKLRPWLLLVVLKNTEFERQQAIRGPLPSIKVLAADGVTTGAESAFFPDPAQSWAWAHTHFNGDLVENLTVVNPTQAELTQAMGRFRALLDQEPDRGVSRLICPRKLEALVDYTAFVIPAFESGRLAGLGAPENLIDTVFAQKASFGEAHDTSGDAAAYADRFPIFYEWSFRCGAGEDFEQLVKKLIPRPVDDRVGKRPMDVQDPGFDINYDPINGLIPNPADLPVSLPLEGALLAPGTTRMPFPWPYSTPYISKLADYLNLSEDLLEATFPSDQHYLNYGTQNGQTIQDDPIVTADIYGRWHALVKRVNKYDDDWIDELNLDPRNRAVAGMGVKYVKDNQESLMDEAWSQLGDVVEANHKLRWGQLSKGASQMGYSKNFDSQPAEQLTALVSRVNSRLRINGQSAAKTLKESALPNAVTRSGYRKIERPNGPIMRRLDPQKTIFRQNQLRVDLGKQQIQVSPTVSSSSFQSDIETANLATDVSRVNQTSFSSATLSVPGIGEDPVVSTFQDQFFFATAVAQYDGYFLEENWQHIAAHNSVDLSVLTTEFKGALHPGTTISASVLANIRIGNPNFVEQPREIVPVMAYPIFKRPVYEFLVAKGDDFLVPNLNLVPNNSISLLETNQRFIESFMTGLNHELGKELLWREFPTDQRGSYFRQFWDTADIVNEQKQDETDFANSLLDIEEIHTWLSTSKLGTHNARAGINDRGNLVLVIRGELLKKYPNVVIYAQEAKWQEGDTARRDHRELGTEIRHPIFGAKVSPDVYFLGFNLTEEEARGNPVVANEPGWFFVLRERPGEIRFGMDVEDGQANAPASWNDLSLSNAPFRREHLDASNNAVQTTAPNGNEIGGKPINWGFNASNFAQILYQNPVMISIHAHEMLP